jgi:hypothetical protein
MAVETRKQKPAAERRHEPRKRVGCSGDLPYRYSEVQSGLTESSALTALAAEEEAEAIRSGALSRIFWCRLWTKAHTK